MKEGNGSGNSVARENRGVMYDFLDRDDRSNSGGSDTGSVDSLGNRSTTHTNIYHGNVH